MCALIVVVQAQSAPKAAPRADLAVEVRRVSMRLFLLHRVECHGAIPAIVKRVLGVFWDVHRLRVEVEGGEGEVEVLMEVGFIGFVGDV